MSRRHLLLRRDYGLLWSAGLVSDTGDWLLMIALPLFAFSATGSALGASTVFLAELIPMLLLGSLLGVLVDRWDRRRTIIVVALLQAVALLPLLAASADRMGIVYAVAAVEAVLGAIINPARQAIVPGIVGEGELGAANGLIAVSDNLARLIGSPLGGAAFAFWGLGGIVLVDAATFVATALLVLGTRREIGRARGPVARDGEEKTEEPVAHAERRLLHEWLEGLRTLLRSGTLRTMTAIAVLAGAAQGIFLVLFIVYLTEEVGAGDAGVGLVRGLQAVGGVLGGLVTGRLLRRFGERAVVGVGFLVFAAMLAVTWNLAPVTTALAVYAGLFIAMGIPAVATGTGEITVVQSATPPAALGRVIAAVTTLGGAAQGVGLLLGGVLAETVGAVPVLDAQAALYALGGVLALVFLRGYGRRREPQPAAVAQTTQPSAAS
jgi:predicted MFS family arabinose efflux permease